MLYICGTIEITREKIKNLPSGNVVNILQLDKDEMVELKNNLEKTLDRLLFSPFSGFMSGNPVASSTAGNRN